MKNKFSILFSIAIIFSFTACSSDNSEKENPLVDKTIIQTDSGKFEIETLKGSTEGKATLVDANGKVIGKGMMIGGKPSGAWVKYDADGKIISAAHYSSEGKPIHELDKNDFDFRIWTNEKLGLSIQVPKAWKELPSINADLVVSFQKTDDDTAVKIKPNFNVARAKLEKGDNLEKLAKMQFDMMHQAFQRVEIVDEKYVNIDSCTAFRRYGKYYLENNMVGFLNVIIVNGNDAWFFSCEAQNKENGEFLKYQGVFQQIAESFKRTK